MSSNDEPSDFNELVAWACWQIITGITKGEPLHKTVFNMLAYVRRWQPKEQR